MVEQVVERKKIVVKKKIAGAKGAKRTGDRTPKVSPTHRPDDMGVEEWQILLRRQFAEKQEFKLENTGDHPVFSEFRLTNPASGKTYRIAIRGETPGENYCSCPDYKINTLGTCKHIEFTLAALRKRRGAVKMLRDGYTPPFSEVYLRYGLGREVRFRAGKGAPDLLLSLAKRFFDEDGVLKQRRLLDLPAFLSAVPRNNCHEVRCYDDVLEYVAGHQDAAHRRSVVDTALPDGIENPLFDTLLKTTLYPYQRQGALFAARAGRCLIGDDMGLGKTIQAIAGAELMARLFAVGKVLIVSPTSLKHQWKSEIEKFTDRTVTVVEGLNERRRELYAADSFFKLVNYELVARDMKLIREWAPDLIILDEAQRIKNWRTRTARCVKELESTYAIVLTGTPIENRIEDLHSIMEFVDRHHLGPLYRFVHNHRMTDAGGKLTGYKDLDKVRKSLEGVMVRRKKDEVLKQLPERIDKTFHVPMTPQHRAIHEEHGEIVAKLVAKWRRYKFLCEADQRRMQMALAAMRMVADNTWLVDKKTKSGPKVEELEQLLLELVVEGGEKVVIFSQWLRMNELVEEVLDRNGIGYVHLNGSVPSKDRKGLMERFREDPACKVFLSTDAGGVGLNLQSGSVVINMDIPWNPAVLEQRIARVHRMGQKRGVRVVNFVSGGSIEERILGLLRFKSSLSAGALDADGDDVVTLGPSQMERFMESVEAATDGLEKRDVEEERRERAEAVAEEAMDAKSDAGETAEPRTDTAGGGTAVPTDQLRELLTGGARLLAGLAEALSAPSASDRAGDKPSQSFGLRVERDETTGKSSLRIPLPEPEVINGMLEGLGRFLSAFGKKGS